ncbi:MAG: metallophosphoesterase [Nanoarchaeota archaeon]|nr:metallophosphoesterase [Nanoarchaeota archaeon]
MLKRRTLILIVILSLMITGAAAVTLISKKDTASDDPTHLFTNTTEEYTFIAFGDTQEPANFVKDKIVEYAIRSRPDFVIHLGDSVDSADPHQWWIYDYSEGLIEDAGIPTYSIVGNHELADMLGIYNSNEEKLSLYFKRHPRLNNNRWYKFQYGKVTFFMLDSEANISEGSPQRRWIAQALPKVKTPYTVVSIHRPPYTGLWKDTDTRELTQWMQTVRPLSMVLSGHTHNYERYIINETIYIVSGGGGSSSHFFKRQPDDYWRFENDTANHFMLFKVTGSKMVGEMMGYFLLQQKFVVYDRFTIESG